MGHISDPQTGLSTYVLDRSFTLLGCQQTDAHNGLLSLHLRGVQKKALQI